MSHAGVGLRKEVIRICVIRLEGNKRKVVCSRRFSCQDVAGMMVFFRGLGRFQVVVEATASYEDPLRFRWAGVSLVPPYLTESSSRYTERPSGGATPDAFTGNRAER